MLESIQNFTNELYRTVVDEQKEHLINTYFSPTSVYLGMLATMLGSRGQTRKEIFQSLGLKDEFNEENSPLTTGKYIASLLRPVPKCLTGSKTETAKIICVNRVFFKASLSLSPEYLKDIEQFYGFQTEFLQFSNYAERDRLHINEWIKEKMENNVTELLPQGTVSKDTKFILTNAMYFKGSWARIFNENNTKRDTFFTLDGRKLTVNMMYQTASHVVQDLPAAYARVLKVSFRDLNWALLLILPNELNGLPDTLTYIRQPGRLAHVLQGTFKSREVQFYFPRFRIYQGHGMNEIKILAKLGITAAFSPQLADFSDICPEGGLFLSQMRHKAIFQVDEDGVSEAPNPVFIGDVPGCYPAVDVFKFDHPFFIAIVAQEKLPVFLGHVVEPEAI